MAPHRFGRRALARHLAIDWALALVLAALLLAVLAVAGCGPGPGGEATVPRTTLPGVRADGSETGWWAPLAVDDDGHAQPVDLSAPAGGPDTGSAYSSGPEPLTALPSRLVLSGDLLFATDSAVVGPDGQRLLDEVAAWLIAHSNAPVNVEGHTDSTDTDAYNLELGQARAEAVASGLEQRGVPADCIGTVTSAGERSPLATNGTAVGRARNRRVELVLPPAAPTTPATR